MPDSKRFLHPEAIERIARLDLRARHVVEGFLSGMHRSPYFGQSVEFLQHREYTPRRRPAPRRLESLGQAGPLLRQAVRGRHEPAAARCWSTSRAACSTARGALNKYDYGCTSPPAWPTCCCASRTPSAAIAFDEAIRVTRAAAQQAQPSDDRSSQALDVSEPEGKDRHLSASCAAWPRAIRAAA